MAWVKKCKRCGAEHEDTLGDQICVDCRKPEEFPEEQQTPEADVPLNDLLAAKDLAIAALNNLANEFLKLKFTDYTRSGKEYQKVIKGQIVIAKQILDKRGS